ncbi:MAG: hypothetical protein HGB19_13560 [Chlorobiales bacterium]|nr:hypothetical protein [Chlorobiales bacterium]
MKNALLIAALLTLLALPAQAQLVRDLPGERISDAAPGLVQSPGGPGLFESFIGSAFNDSHFQMHHSYSLQYSSGMNNTVGEYVNTMTYQFDFPLTLRTDIGVMHQPFGASNEQLKQGIGSDAFTGLYLKNASATYRPTRDLTIGILFQQYRPGDPSYFWSRNPFSPYGGW